MCPPQQCHRASTSPSVPEAADAMSLTTVIDYTMPCIITLEAVNKAIKEDPAIKSMLDYFANEFSKSDLRAKKGRGGMPCPANIAATAQASDILEKVLPGLFQNSTSAKVVSLTKLGMWAVAKDQCKAFTEPECLASVRYQSLGTREVVLASFTGLRDFLVEEKGVDIKVVTPVRCASFLHHGQAGP